MLADTVLKTVRGFVGIRGGTDNTIIGNSSDSLKVIASQSGTYSVTGTVTANQGGAPWSQNITQVNGNTILTGNGVTGTGSIRVTIASDNTAFSVNAVQSGTWNINNISGTISLPTGAATEATLAKLTQTQGSTTSGQSGPLILGAVTTSAPTYTTAQSSPISLTTAGALRVDGSGTTQPISGTVAATQSGTWTVQPGNTANTTAWLVTGTGGTFPITIATDNNNQLGQIVDLLNRLLTELKATRMASSALIGEIIQGYIADDFDPNGTDYRQIN